MLLRPEITVRFYFNPCSVLSWWRKLKQIQAVWPLPVTETRSTCGRESASNKTFTHNSHSSTQTEARPLIPSLYWVRCHMSLMTTYISVQKEPHIYIYLHTQSKHPMNLQWGPQSNYSEEFATVALIHQSWIVNTYSNTLKDEVCHFYAISKTTQNCKNSFSFWRNSPPLLLAYWAEFIWTCGLS